MKMKLKKEKILNLKRRYKVLVLILNDLSLLILSLFLSFFLISDALIFEFESNLFFLFVPLAGLLISYFLGIYRVVLRYINLVTLWQIFKATTAY